MGTSYDKIYRIFSNKIVDYEPLLMSDDELRSYCHSFLASAMVKIKNFDHDLSDRDDVIASFGVDLSDKECEVIACQMVVEWVERKTNTVQNIHMFVGTKDESMASQANHIRALLELRDKQTALISVIIRDHKYRAWIEEA